VGKVGGRFLFARVIFFVRATKLLRLDCGRS
jgi:hypothetical protein